MSGFHSLTGAWSVFKQGFRDATDDHRLQRRHDFQVCGEATAGKGRVATGQGVNDIHLDEPEQTAVALRCSRAQARRRFGKALAFWPGAACLSAIILRNTSGR